MYCDAVAVSLCNETLWKCHYAVLCLQSAPSGLALVLNCCIHIGVWRVLNGSDTARVSPVLRTFVVSLMYCDAVTVPLCNETLWKCHYAVLCLQSAPSVLALVLNCCIHIGVWRVLTLQECHQFGGHLWSLMYCDAVTLSLINETLWKCHYAVLYSQIAPSVLALVFNCCIRIRVWRVLTLQECHSSLEDIYDHYMSDDLNLGWRILLVSGHRMPKPCKAMGNLKSDTPS